MHGAKIIPITGRTMATEHTIDRDSTRHYLSEVLDTVGTSITGLAKQAGVSASTLYRIVDDDDPYITSQRTIAKIEKATGISYAAVLSGGFGEAPAEALRMEGEDIPAELKPANAGQGVWRLGSRAVELAGYLPGDLILFDIGPQPAPGDLVLAQLEDRSGGDETLIRVFEPPYLMVRTFDPAADQRPVLIDGVQARVVGRFNRMLRRRAAATATAQATG